MRKMNSNSFEEFLDTWHLTPEDLIEFCTYGGKRILDRAAKDNDAHDISISSLFIFNDCGGYSSNTWYKIRDDWDIIRHGNSEIPFNKSHWQTLKKLNDKKFNEELL